MFSVSQWIPAMTANVIAGLPLHALKRSLNLSQFVEAQKRV
jgi:hypothetical protein